MNPTEMIPTEKNQSIKEEELETLLENTKIESDNEDDNTMKKRKNHTQIFGSIVDFVLALKDLYGDTFYELKLYSLLLENTGLIHEEQVEKHISIMESFLVANKESLPDKKIELLKEECLCFSDKIFINIKSILEMASSDNREIIWEHLYSLFALICPKDNILNQIVQKSVSRSIKEDNIFQKMFETFKDVMPSDANEGNMENPLDMVSKLMEGDMMKNMVSTLSNSLGNTESGATPSEFSQIFQGITGMMGELTKNMDKKN